MNKVLGATAMGVAMATSQAAAEGGSYGNYEAPRYSLQARIGAAELRRYASQVSAHVTVEGSRRGALTQGFRILAGYIFGGNGQAASVAMTSPVTQTAKIDMTAPVSQSGANGTWMVTFMMPSQFSLDTLPPPTDTRVRFSQTEPSDLLVLPFSGFAGDGRLGAKTKQLRAIAADAGIPISGEPIFMFYDDPMTLPWQRRNEVAFALTP